MYITFKSHVNTLRKGKSKKQSLNREEQKSRIMITQNLRNEYWEESMIFFPILWQEHLFLKSKHMNYSCYTDKRLEYNYLR